MKILYLTILGVIVALALMIRKWVDEKKENLLDIEIVREDEEHLGIWANKSKEALMLFRLRRDETFLYKYVQYPGTDTLTKKGRYELIGAGNGRSTDYYPRLIAIEDNNDTLFNFYIAYITPYDSKVERYDKMVLNRNSLYDTAGYVFYRIKP